MLLQDFAFLQRVLAVRGKRLYRSSKAAIVVVGGIILVLICWWLDARRCWMRRVPRRM